MYAVGILGLYPITPKEGAMGTPAVHPITPKEGVMGTPVGAQR